MYQVPTFFKDLTNPVVRIGKHPIVSLNESGYSEHMLAETFAFKDNPVSTIIANYHLLEDKATSFSERPVRTGFQDGFFAGVGGLLSFDAGTYVDLVAAAPLAAGRAIAKGFEAGCKQSC